MDPFVRLGVIIGGIALLFLFLGLNKYVAKRVWLDVIEDEDGEDRHEP